MSKRFKLVLYILDILLLICAIVFYTLSFFVSPYWVKLTGIICLSTYYYACVRPLAGLVIDRTFHNKIDYHRFWYREKRFEKKLFKILKVQSWKKIAFTYKPEYFDIRKTPLEDIIGATCQAELVHESMFIMSLLGLLLIIPFGEPIVYIIATSITCLFEMFFVILQRYNRPRLVKLYEKKKMLKK